MKMVAKDGNLKLLEMFLSEHAAGIFYCKWLYAARGASSSASGGIAILKTLLDPR